MLQGVNKCDDVTAFFSFSASLIELNEGSTFMKVER
jgi:hypothetical protein